MKGALNTLSQELNPHKAILEAEPKYRKNLAQSLLYKTFLSIIYETLDEKMKSAVKNVLNRDVSSGQQFYKTDQDLWPMNKGTLGIQIRNMKMDFNIYGTWRWVTFEKLMMKIYDLFYQNHCEDGTFYNTILYGVTK